MEHIKEIVKEYIEKEDTDYALFIKGEWGSGKTHYWENVLKPYIESLPEDTTEGSDKFKTIYISLFGVSDISQISREILSNKFGINKNNKYGNLLMHAGDLTSRVLSKYVLSDEKDGENVIATLSDTFDNRKFVFCFDDLERSQIKPLDKVIGFLSANLLYKNNKVLLIGNEIKLDDESQKIKEKIIGHEIEYKLDAQHIMNILNNEYSTNEKMTQLLKKEAGLIKEAITKDEKQNLRTLLRAFEIINRCLSNTDDKVIKHFGKRLVYFVLILMIEFKEGKINKSDCGQLLSFYTDPMMNRIIINPKKEGSENEKYKNTNDFYRKYVSGNNNLYMYFESIAKYIMDGYFDEEIFLSETKVIIENEYSKALHTLYNNWYILEKAEFKEFYDTMITGINQKEYSFYDYIRISSLIEVFDKEGILEIDFEDFFKKVINIVDNYELTPNEIDEDFFSTPRFKSIDGNFKNVYDLAKNKQKEAVNTLNKNAVESEFEEILLEGIIDVSYDIATYLKTIGNKKIELLLTQAPNKGLYQFALMLVREHYVIVQEKSDVSHEVSINKLDDLEKVIKELLTSNEDDELKCYHMNKILESIQEKKEEFQKNTKSRSS